MKFVFLILHYQVIEETLKAVTSIKKHMPKNTYEIVIVDNASTNHSGDELTRQFEQDASVHVLLNRENLGFARGNNVGFDYILENLDFDFIVAMNNDTCLLQDDFAQLVTNSYHQHHFAVLGPKIKLPNNEYYYVVEDKIDENKMRNDLKKFKLLRFLNRLGIRDVLFKLLRQRQLSADKNNPNIHQFHENILLNGCFLVFSRDYFDYYRGFNDATYMYREEEFLYFMCQKRNLKMIYDPQIEIWHNEDQATNAIVKNSRAKNEFFYKNSIDSLEKLLQYLQS